MRFPEFLDYFMRLGAEFFRRYYGPYRAVVTENVDPENRGRILVECQRARLLSSNNRWILPMMSTGPASGAFWPPEKGAWVWIFFDNGDPMQPACYLGGGYGPKEGVALAQRPAGAPKKRGWTTPAGNNITLDDTKDAETITIEQKDGKIVKITKDKVSIGTKDGAFEPMMKGSTVKNWLINHGHSHSWGVTGPPIQPFPVDGLSDDTETS